MGVPVALATRQSSFEFMRAHAHQSDEHSMAQRMSSAKVRAALDEAWEKELAGPLGIRSHEKLRAWVRETAQRR